LRWVCSSIVIVCVLAGCQPTGPQLIRQYNTEGVDLLRHQEYAAAQQRFQEAVRLDPDDALSLYNLGNAAHQSGDLVLAEKSYRDSLQRQPNYAPCRHGLALLLLQTDRGDAARELVAAWLRDRPELADAHAEDGWLLRESGDLPAAQARLQKAIEMDPGCIRGLIELGIVYETYDYPDRARGLYQRALKRDPTQPEALGRLTGLRKGRSGE
jgi:tetratricopeptide (TPR) repeat protein